jgi:hypothetical protein
VPYRSRSGRRPDEYASKSAHTHIIQDATVQQFLSQCDIPKKADEIDLRRHKIVDFSPVLPNPLEHVIAVDSGYSDVSVQKEFPSAKIGFFQFGALTFSMADLEALGRSEFIDPDDVAKLKQIQRIELVLPLRNVVLKSQDSLKHSVRRAVYEFFRKQVDEGELIETLSWLLFQEYGPGVNEWQLGSCPHCSEARIPLRREAMSKDYTFRCTECEREILLTDVFRLHEAVDNDIGAGGVVGYVTTTFEQLLLAHCIRLILQVRPGLLKRILFIKDGPLAFFGQTANMHKPMRYLCAYLLEHHDLYMAGLEKGGPFVENADEVAPKLGNGSILILDDDYIYDYVMPAKGDSERQFGRSTYYSNKVVFKTRDGHVHVVSIPTTTILDHPSLEDLHNLGTILTNVELLRCDMYDNALIPVALANKLVSLSAHPSAKILTQFAGNAVHA